MTHGTMRAILDTSISPLEPIRTQPFACDFWPKEDAARTVLASQALFPECREASALQRSGDFVLILAKGGLAIRSEPRCDAGATPMAPCAKTLTRGRRPMDRLLRAVCRGLI